MENNSPAWKLFVNPKKVRCPAWRERNHSLAYDVLQMNVPLSESLGHVIFSQTWFVGHVCVVHDRVCNNHRHHRHYKKRRDTTTEMLGFTNNNRSLTALLSCYSWLWLTLFVARVSCQQDVSSSSLDPAAIVPFFVRRDEGGELVVVVVYGPHYYEKVAVYCRDDIRDGGDGGDVRRRSRDLVTQGPGVMQCFRTNGEDDDEYDLILPFTFVRDDASGVITGVSFADSEGIVVSFRTETNSNGKVMATTFDRTKEANDASSSSSSTSAAAQPEYRIPYSITTSADGTVVAIVFVGDEELTIPLRYVMDSDGSRVVGVSFGSDIAERRNIFGGGDLDASLVGIVVFLVLLACVGLYLTKRKRCHDRRRGDYNNTNINNGDDHSRNSLKEGSDSATITDFDDMETIPVI
jgi:hypothetical protein